MVQITQSNPNWMKAIDLKVKELDSTQGKVGWFESAKYQDGTPVAYVATINEYGCPERSIPARPFMRPTASDKSNEWRETAVALSKKMLKGVITAADVMELLTMKAEGDVLKTISRVVSPPLSMLTLLARKRRQEGGSVTGKTLGEFAKELAKGAPDVSGVSTKPLNDTGYMISTLTHTVEKA